MESELNLQKKHLIHKGILNANTGQSYFDFIEKVAETNTLNIILDNHISRNLRRLMTKKYYINLYNYNK